MAENRPFDRATLEQALRELGRRAHAAGKVIEIAIYGGCAVMLTLNYRLATRDVDAVFEKDRELVRKIAADMADEYGWDKDWLNDGVKGFLSAAETDPAAKVFVGTYPSEAQPGLRVFVPRPEYLFAMKCRAMRVGGVEGSQDIEDIRRLAAAIGIKNAQEALDLVQAFYPRHIIEPKTQFGLEEIFSKLGDRGAAPGSPTKS
jgi:predicted nucleotidyltransferase